MSHLHPSIVHMDTDTSVARKVYNEWAVSYEATVRTWGYDMPERVASLLRRYLPPQCTILDAGAGDGLSGLALRAEGFQNVYGNDLSPDMLKIAETRKCYSNLMEVNLNKVPLPYEGDQFDAVTCVGTLTYVDPKSGILEDFTRVCRKGGFICYTNRCDKLEQWKSHEQCLINDKKLEVVEETEPLPYLPGNPEFADEKLVKIFLFKVL